MYAYGECFTGTAFALNIYSKTTTQTTFMKALVKSFAITIADHSTLNIHYQLEHLDGSAIYIGRAFVLNADGMREKDAFSFELKLSTHDNEKHGSVKINALLNNLKPYSSQIEDDILTSIYNLEHDMLK